MKKYIFGAIIGLAAFILVGGTVAAAHGFGHAGASEDTAQLLGMTNDQLQTALDDQTLPELLDEKGISHVELQEFRDEHMLDERAALLGMTADELRTALESKSFAELLDEKGISHVQLHSFMQTQHLERAQTHLQSLVDDGTITQEQMDARLEQMQSTDRPGLGHGPR
ncbi:MAG: hypothetical protein HZC01_04540 [Candidatus Kerfeldbacteria bacterium]|nr:hypothetical protein [Candidatus Kerfeldbacteria bacterium]